VVAGILGALGGERAATSFVDGAASLAGAALVVVWRAACW